jgi:Spy/CpxP family protein refolding chaperone
MKIRWITGILIAGLAISALAQTEHPQPPGIGGLTATEPSDDPSVDPNSTLQPRDALNTYEEQMVLVTVETYKELAQIAQAVRAGQISSDEAVYLTRRYFELSIIRLQFLDTLHQILETKVSKESTPANLEEQTQVETSDQTLIVVPPASSPDISEAMAKYLELTPTQIAAIQARVSEEQKYVQPLVQQLAQNRKALATATQIKPSSNNKIRTLAIEQSHILERLIIANSRLQRDISEILTIEQRKKLERVGQDAAIQSPQVQDVTPGSPGDAQAFEGMHR